MMAWRCMQGKIIISLVFAHFYQHPLFLLIKANVIQVFQNFWRSLGWRKDGISVCMEGMGCIWRIGVFLA